MCLDVDECLEQPQRCEHMCENTVGGFQCLCPRATRLANDGISCSRKKYITKTKLTLLILDSSITPELFFQEVQFLVQCYLSYCRGKPE